MSCQRWHRTWTREQQRCHLKRAHFSHAVKHSSSYSMSGILYPTLAFGILSHGTDWKTLITILPENQSCAGTPKWNNPVKDNKSILFTWGCIWILTLRFTCAKEGGSPKHTRGCCLRPHLSFLPFLIRASRSFSDQQQDRRHLHSQTSGLWKCDKLRPPGPGGLHGGRHVQPARAFEK